MRIVVLFAFVLVFGSTLPSSSAIAAGADLYQEFCADCHSIRPGKQKKGPSLARIMGAKAGKQSDYVYSDALLASGIVWTASKMNAYLANPKAVVPGGKMKFEGPDTAAQRTELIQYLSTLR